MYIKLVFVVASLLYIHHRLEPNGTNEMYLKFAQKKTNQNAIYREQKTSELATHVLKTTCQVYIG